MNVRFYEPAAHQPAAKIEFLLFRAQIGFDRRDPAFFNSDIGQLVKWLILDACVSKNGVHKFFPITTMGRG